MKKEFTFYEFVGIIAPGAVFLIGLRYCSPDLAIFLAKPEFSVGDLGVFIILAYVLGALIQAVGNLLETGWWKMFGGMPTQWVCREKCPYLSGDQIEVLPKKMSALFGFEVHKPSKYSAKDWFAITRQAAAALHQNKAADRLETFNGNYGLFRGIAAALLLTVVAILIGQNLGAWKETLKETWKEILVATALLVMAIARMDRFGRHYARELFVQILQIDPTKKKPEESSK